MFDRLLAIGVLAMLVTAAAAPAQDTLHGRVAHALDQARPALLAHLRAATDGTASPGELALLALAAAHDGLTQQEPLFARAIDALARSQPSGTYDLALRLLVCEAVADFPRREETAAADAKALLQHRHKNGAFGYHRNPGGWDLSNTQYGALGLRAAQALGVAIDPATWQRLATAISEQQDAQGGFGYARRGSPANAYPSMTVAGIAVLAICAQRLAGDGGAPKALAARIDSGWQWMARNHAAIGSRQTTWSYYFHYGLERAAILCDVAEVGPIDWYAAGASMLCDEQLAGGGWRSTADAHPGGHLGAGRGDLVPTSFAVLFLRRKFQKHAGPITARIVQLANLGPLAKAEDVRACAIGLASRGKEAMPEVLHALRSEIEPQRRAAAQALQQIAGEAFGYDAGRSAAANRPAVRAAELWYLRHR